LSSEAARKGIALEKNLKITDVFADRGSIGKILLNLLSNAIRFTPAGGRICLKSVRDVNGWTLSVHDSGPGLSAEQLSQISKPFEQLCSEAALSRQGAGAGIGLALVRSLTEAHGGKIQIESAIDKGTCVSLRFPLEADP